MFYWTSLLVDLAFVPTVLLKATVLLAGAWVMHGMLQGRNPRWRVLLWRYVLVAIVALPVAEWTLPRLNVEVAQDAVAELPDPAGTAEVQPAPMELSETHSSEGLFVEQLPASGPVRATPPPPNAFNAMNWAKQHAMDIALALWGLVGSLLFMRIGIAWVRLRKTVSESKPAPDAVLSLAASIAEQLDVRARYSVSISDCSISPFLTGVQTPVIVLPRRSLRMSVADRLPAILAHELSHAKAYDPFWMACLKFAATLFWFHPLMWRVRTAHSDACEEVCDGVATAHVGSAESYSKTLALEVLALQGVRPLGAGVPMVRRSEIIGRLRKIERGIRSTPLALRWVVASLIMAAPLFGALGSLRWVAAQTVEVSETYPHEIAIETYQPDWATFQPGDSIEILDVRGTTPEFKEGEDFYVRGRYTLVSRDAAQLHVYATNGNVESEQGPDVLKGEDEFTREFTLMKSGMPHVSFYPVGGGDGIGGTYFRRPDSYPPVDFGAALPPIELDASAGDTMVKLQGLQVQLLAIVPAQEDVINAQGSSVPENSWGSSGEEIIREFREPSGTTDIDQADQLGVLFHLAPTQVFEGDYELRTAHLLAQGYRNYGNMRFGDVHSPEPMFSAFELAEFFRSSESRTIKLSDVQADISYGPPLELYADIPSDARNTEIEIGSWKFTATVNRLPDRQPGEEVPAKERPVVTLTFSEGGPLTNVEVVAIDRNGEPVEAYNVEDLSRLVHGKAYTWEFGWPEPISNQSIQGFRLIGHRLQPIIWRNVALMAAATDNHATETSTIRPNIEGDTENPTDDTLQTRVYDLKSRYVRDLETRFAEDGITVVRLGSEDPVDVTTFLRQLVPDVTEPDSGEVLSQFIFNDSTGQILVHHMPNRLTQIEQLLSEVESLPEYSAQVPSTGRHVVVNPNDLLPTKRFMGLMLEGKAHRAALKAHSAERLAVLEPRQSATWKRAAESAREEQARYWNQAIAIWEELSDKDDAGDTFALGRLYRRNAISKAEQGKYAEAIAILDVGRWENNSLWNEATELIIEYKSIAGEPLTATEQEAKNRNEDRERTSGLVPRQLGDDYYRYSGGAWRPNSYLNQPTRDLQPDSLEYHRLQFNHPGIANVTNLGGDVIFQRGEQWYHFKANPIS